MKKTKIMALCTAVILGSLCLAGCSSSSEKNNSENKSSVSASQQKPVMLVVSFGTSYNETRAKTIEAIENKISETYSDYDVRRAFTSQTIIDKLEDRDKLEIDNIAEAMDKIVSEGIKEVVVQSTHVMNGIEYEEMMTALEPYKDKVTIKTGQPLLSSDDDFKKVAEILVKDTEKYNNEETAIVFMGHGTHHDANSTYSKLDECFKSSGHNNYIVGTVEASPSLEDVMSAVENGGYKKVVLLPLMIVAGDHASNDMAGDEEGSWKTEFKSAGYEVECVLKGLGEYPEIQEIFIEHAGEVK